VRCRELLQVWERKVIGAAKPEPQVISVRVEGELQAVSVFVTSGTSGTGKLFMWEPGKSLERVHRGKGAMKRWAVAVSYDFKLFSYEERGS